MDTQGWGNVVAEKWQKTAQQLHREAWDTLRSEGLHFYSQEIAWQWKELREDRRRWEALDDQKMVESIAQDMDALVEQDELLEMLHFDETIVDKGMPYEPESITEASGEVF